MGCIYARKEGRLWICPEGLTKPTKNKRDFRFCGDYNQQALCGNESARGISDDHMHGASRGKRDSVPFWGLDMGASMKGRSSGHRKLVRHTEKAASSE